MEQLIDPKILAIGTMLIGPAKIFVDYVKMNAELPKWSPPAVAFLFALVMLTVVNASTGAPISAKAVADMILASGTAAFGAVFVNEWHKTARAGKKSS